MNTPLLVACLQHTATHCNTLQHTATHRNTLQHPATPCNTGQRVQQRYEYAIAGGMCGGPCRRGEAAACLWRQRADVQ